LQAIIDLNKSLATKKHLILNFDYDETIPFYLIGDPVRVQRIVLELITNALTFTQHGGIAVIVKLKQQDEQRVVIELIVSDTGRGIPAEKREEIFIRFKRLTPSYQGIYKGLGLGLSLVKQFIEDLAGEIYVNSEPGGGSRFTCLIHFQKPLVMDATGIENTPSNLHAHYPKSVKSKEMLIQEKGSTHRCIPLVKNDLQQITFQGNLCKLYNEK
jgi:two-component system, OmpR family, aerobic respiration control sensor histidine kinase ArcB